MNQKLIDYRVYLQKRLNKNIIRYEGLLSIIGRPDEFIIYHNSILELSYSLEVIRETLETAKSYTEMKEVSDLLVSRLLTATMSKNLTAYAKAWGEELEIFNTPGLW